MKKYLVIAEKPKAARALCEGLGISKFHFVSKGKASKLSAAPGYYDSDDVTIVYVSGHIMSLYDVEDYIYGVNAQLTPEQKYWSSVPLPFIPKDGFKKKISKSNGGFYEKQYKIIKDLINSNNYECVVNFGDPDNEGELLIREILESIGYTKPVKRLFNNSLVPSVLAEEFYCNLKNDSDYTSMYFQALARQQTDWLLGINLTRFLTLKANEAKKRGSTLWRVGRVIVPLVKYVYDRDLEIKNFDSKKGFGINAVISRDDYEHTFSSSDPKIYFSENEKGLCDDLCNKLSTQPFTVIDVKKSKFKIKPHKLMSLTDFRSEMNKKYGCSVSESSKIAQNLYEMGYITYPRTNSQYLSTKEGENVKKIINILNQKYNGMALVFNDSKTIFDDSKISDEGHTALTLTTKTPNATDLQSFDENTRNAYRLIMARFITNFSARPIIEETTVMFQCGEYKFKLIGNEIIEKGFLRYEERKLPEKVPDFQIGEVVSAKFSVVERETKPPAPVSVAELLEFSSNPYKKELKAANPNDDTEYYKLLKEGVTIGTQSTLDSIIGNAIKEGYIIANKKNYRIGEKGVALIQLLDELNVNLYKERNIEMNKAIKCVGSKTLTIKQNEQNIRNELENIINNGKDVSVNINQIGSVCKCPLCGGNVFYNSKLKAYCCENTLKDCKFGIFENNAYLQKWGVKVNKTTVSGFARNMFITFTAKPKDPSKSTYKVKIKIKSFKEKNQPQFETELPKS